MLPKFSFFLLSLALSLGAQEKTWELGEVRATFNPQNRNFSIHTEKRNFSPLLGAGPILLRNDQSVLPNHQKLSLRDSYVDSDSIRSTWQTDGGNSFTLEITARETAGVAIFRFRWHSAQPTWAGISPGLAVGAGKQQPFFFNRDSEAYGQAGGGSTFHCPKAGIWLFAAWDVSSSNLSAHQRIRRLTPVEMNTNFPVDLTPETIAAGNLPFPIAGNTVYHPNTEGQRLPLDDTLVLRVGKQLWDTVPTPSQPPSPYRQELAESAFIDIWGGHHAPQLTHKLRLLQRILRGQVRCYTILQNWQCGGFDTLQPLSVRMPDYPPSAYVGTIEELRELCETGKRLGRFGFRTNYMFFKKHSPVVTSGEVRQAQKSDGSPRHFARLSDILPLAHRQEAEIASLFGANTTFSDQLGSAGSCQAYTDYNAALGSPALRQTQARVKGLCEFLRQTHNGPLSSETMNGDFLLGGWIDTGDFGMFGGHKRALVPDYKLRKLQHLTTFHGMAMGYRFMFGPPYGGNSKHQDGEAMYVAPGFPADDYRACEVLYGNAAYLYLLPTMTWRQILSELVIIGRLQRHYALIPVSSIEYFQPATQEWLTLEALAQSGVNVTPVRWIKQPTAMQIARIRYSNGLQVTVNRSPDTISAPCGNRALQLPPAGWCAFRPDNGFTAFSAFWPETQSRVDYLEDPDIDWRFLDPRGSTIEHISHPTLSVNGKPVVELLPEEQLRIDGNIVPGQLPKPPPTTSIDFDFTHKRAHGWHAAREILRLVPREEGLDLRTCGHDPYIVGPPMLIPKNQVKTLIITLKSKEPGTAAFFWATTTKNSFHGNMVRTFKIEAGDTFKEYRIPVGDHPEWQDKIITRLRFDPLCHDGIFDLQIQSIRAE